MATTTNVTSASKVDPRIYHPLGKLRGAIRRYVAFEGLATLLIFLASWFWIGLTLDFGLFRLTSFDWVVDAHKGFRIVALVAIVAALLALVVTRLIIRFTRDFSAPALALVLEKRFPKLLGDRLITAVELADTKQAASYGYSEELILETIKDVRGKVDQIPVSEVFNWKRLWLRIGLVFALWIGLLAVVSTTLILVYKFSVERYFAKFADVSVTWAQRNILLQDIPWPRNTHLEILEPTEFDRHVGRDKPELTVRVVAYKWVWADPTHPSGWRPLTWADVPKALPGETVPTLPIEAIKAFAKTAPFLTGTMFDAAPKLELPSDLVDVPEDPAGWRADRLEILLAKNDKLKRFLTVAPKDGQPLMSDDDLAKISAVFNRLTERADDPAMSRTLRKLSIPKTAVLYHRGEKTKGEKAAEPDKYNEFKFQLTNLQESVTYRIHGGDFSTQERKITLVPAPSIIELKLKEMAPAYHYYLPPLKDTNAVAASPELLKPLKQARNATASVAGGKSSLQIYAGSDLTIEAATDKELLTVMLTPTIGLFPGVDSKDQAAPIPLKIRPDGKSFSMSFDTEGKPLAEWQKAAREFKDFTQLPENWHPVFPQALRPLEFEVSFTDTDKVTSRRIFSIQIEEDRGPEVNIAISGLRKVAGIFMCSANANIPFTSDSNVRDDYGLHKLEYLFSYSKIEPQVDPNVKVAPPTVIEQHISIPEFESRYQQQGRNAIYLLNTLEEKLKQPLPDNFAKPFVTYYQFGAGETFDLMKRIPTLASNDVTTQLTFNLNLNVRATESNVLFGPRTAQNKDPINLKVVGYLELLNEISRDQQELAAVMDEALKKLTTCQTNLNDVVARSATLNPMNPSSFDDLITRGLTIQEDMVRANEFLMRVLTSYEKLVEELQINRFEKYQARIIDDTRSRIVNPMKDVLDGSFGSYVRAESAIGSLVNALRQVVVPDPATSTSAKQRLNELIDNLKLIRASMGDTLDLQKTRQHLAQLRDRYIFLEKEIRDIKIVKQREVFYFTFYGLLKQYTIKKGETLNLNLRYRLPTNLLNDPALKFEVAKESGLTVTPAEAVLKEQPLDQELKLEIKAGNVLGSHKVTIIPSQNTGPEIEIVVIP
jgi:hypothetical protein